MLRDFYLEKFSYENSIDKIYELKKQYGILPEIVGKSVLGRKIFAIPIGNKPNNILYVGTVHGMEWITSHILFKFCEDILKAQENGESLFGIEISKMLTTRGAYIVPFLNPDGAQLQTQGKSSAHQYGDELAKLCDGDFTHWQANARGIDLNHNFNAGFKILKEMELAEGITGPCPTKYGGEYPVSEPETKSIVNFIMKKDIKTLYAFHSQGEEIYYKYGENTPKESALIANLLGQYCGYDVLEPVGTASHGGLKDWFIEYFGRSGFTFEVGKGKNPLDIKEFHSIYNKLKEALVLSLIL